MLYSAVVFFFPELVSFDSSSCDDIVSSLALISDACAASAAQCGMLLAGFAACEPSTLAYFGPEDSSSSVASRHCDISVSYAYLPDACDNAAELDSREGLGVLSINLVI